MIDPLTKNLVIQTYTLDKEYWHGSDAVKKLKNFILDIHKKGNLNKIFWITDRPKHSVKHGFRQSKNVLMEYCEEEDNKDELKNKLQVQSDNKLSECKEKIEKE